jgi:hypothetical protein
MARRPRPGSARHPGDTARVGPERARRTSEATLV